MQGQQALKVRHVQVGPRLHQPLGLGQPIVPDGLVQGGTPVRVLPIEQRPMRVKQLHGLQAVHAARLHGADQCHTADLRLQCLSSLRLGGPHLHHAVAGAAVAAEGWVALRTLDRAAQPLVGLRKRFCGVCQMPSVLAVGASLFMSFPPKHS